MCKFKNTCNAALRELHVAVTNAAKEPVKCSPNNDPRVKTLKRNKARKHLMSTDPENYIKAETAMVLQYFE